MLMLAKELSAHFEKTINSSSVIKVYLFGFAYDLFCYLRCISDEIPDFL
jgi:hypothetical protein